MMKMENKQARRTHTNRSKRNCDLKQSKIRENLSEPNFFMKANTKLSSI